MAHSLATRLTTLLGCRYPIIQTAMGWVATDALVTGSVRAGAFGFLAAAVMTPDECEASIRRIRAGTQAPFGVNVHSFQPGVDAIIDLCMEHRVAAISYGRAPSAQIIDRVKAAGILCAPTIGAAKHARKAIDLGADLLVCQGQEGGGHTGQTPTWLLLSQVLDMDPGVPVVACGGFKDGRGLAAALTYGADGIAMGTRFLLTAESPLPEATRAAYLASEVTRIPVSTKLDGLPQRMVMNEQLAKLEQSGYLGMLARALLGGWRFKRQMNVSIREMLRTALAMVRDTDLTLGQALMAANAPMMIQQAMVHGRPDKGVLPSGQVAGLIATVPTCAALVGDIVEDALAHLASAHSLVQATEGAKDAV